MSTEKSVVELATAVFVKYKMFCNYKGFAGRLLPVWLEYEHVATLETLSNTIELIHCPCRPCVNVFSYPIYTFNQIFDLKTITRAKLSPIAAHTAPDPPWPPSWMVSPCTICPLWAVLGPMGSGPAFRWLHVSPLGLCLNLEKWPVEEEVGVSLLILEQL